MDGAEAQRTASRAQSTTEDERAATEREAHAPDGQITQEGAQIVLNVLAAFLPEVKAANIKVEDTYDNRFVENALKKFQGKM